MEKGEVRPDRAPVDRRAQPAAATAAAADDAPASACEWGGCRGPPQPPPPRDEMSSAYSSSSEPPGWTEEPWGLANATNGTSPGPAGLVPGLGDSVLASVAAAASGLVSGLGQGLGQGLAGQGQTRPAGEDAWSNATMATMATASMASASAAALAQNASLGGNQTVAGLPAFCEGWEALQNNMFQVSNLFFCIAFLVPRTFKQSVLLYRFLLVVGFMLAAVWSSFHLCAFDVFLWSMALMAVNGVHTAFLVVRFLPPALSPDLTELYLKVFKPLKVSKKAFKELAREGSVLTLEAGDTYAVEEQTPADERLSILLKGKLAVSCDGTHLHHINTHQFVDSPEWEANHDSSENTFQVTISAEEESLYLCWPRMKLSRVLRHRPQVRIVLDTLIGKDITHKLYSLNEQMHGAGERAKAVRSDHWRRSMARSVSVDAVNTGTRGNVRSTAFKSARKERAASAAALGEDAQAVLQSPVRHGSAQCWIPLVANHFPVSSPFTDAQGVPQPLTAAVANAPLGTMGPMGPLGMSLAPMPPGVAGVPVSGVSAMNMSGVPGVPVTMPGMQLPSSMALVPVPVIVPVLAPPPTLHQARNRTMRRAAGVGMAGVAGGGVPGMPGVGIPGVGVPGVAAGPSNVKFEATPV